MFFPKPSRVEPYPSLTKFTSTLDSSLFLEESNIKHKLHTQSIQKKSLADDDVRITHSENPAYWIRRFSTDESSYGRVAKLISVCWIQVHCSVLGVPSGKYIVYIRMKSNGKNFCGNWRVGTGSRSIRQFGPDRAQNAQEAVMFMRSNDRDLPEKEWTHVVVGTIQLHQPSDLEVLFLGGNPSWTCSILFDHVGLIPIGAGWDVRRLFLLGMGRGMDRRRKLYRQLLLLLPKMRRRCCLGLLNNDCIAHILEYL